MDRDGLESARHARAWVLCVLGIVAASVFLPAAWSMEWAQFYTRPGAQSLLSTLAGIPVFYLLVHGILILPVLRSGFFEADQSPARLLGAALLWALPLASFAYWKGDFRDALHAGDFGVQLAVALAFGLVLYARTGNRWVVTLSLVWGVYVPIYLVGDILGPFTPRYVFAPTTPAVYLFRAVCDAMMLLIAATGQVPLIGRAPDRLRAFRLGACLLAVAGLLAAVGRRLSEAPTSAPLGDWDFVGFLVLVFFLDRKDGFGRRVFWTLCVFQGVTLAGRGLWNLVYGDGGWTSQVGLVVEVLGVALVATEARRRGRQAEFAKTSSAGGRGKPSSASARSARV